MHKALLWGKINHKLFRVRCQPSVDPVVWDFRVLSSRPVSCWINLLGSMQMSTSVLVIGALHQWHSHTLSQWCYLQLCAAYEGGKDPFIYVVCIMHTVWQIFFDPLPPSLEPWSQQWDINCVNNRSRIVHLIPSLCHFEAFLKRPIIRIGLVRMLRRFWW